MQQRQQRQQRQKSEVAERKMDRSGSDIVFSRVPLTALSKKLSDYKSSQRPTCRCWRYKEHSKHMRGPMRSASIGNSALDL